MARSIVSLYTEAFFAFSTAAARRGFVSASAPPSLAATMISRTSFTTIWPFLCALASRPACFHCAPIVQDQCVEARFMVQWKRNDWLDVFYSFRLNLPMKLLLVLALLF